MGNYQDLINLEKRAKPHPQNIPSSHAREAETHPAILLPTMQAHKSTSPQVDKSASGQTPKVTLERSERYTTRLLPSMIRKIKAYAFQNDIDHYDVVQKALNEFFARNK